MTEKFDVIIIGAGVNGLATAWHLVHKEKCRVLLIEQFPFPHTRGSSHGHTRITRRCYSEDYYCSMMRESYKIWEEIERISGEKLYLKSGLLFTGKESNVDACENALKSHKFGYDRYTYEDIHRNYPQFCDYTGMSFVYDPEAGILLADKCLLALHRLFVSYEGVFQDCEPVVSLLPSSSTSGDVTVQTTKATYVGRTVIVTAGPWTNKLMTGLGLELPLVPTKICLAYWKIKESSPVSFQMPHFPTFIHECDDFHIYAIPEYEYPGCIKLAYHDGTATDPDYRDFTEFSETAIVKMKKYVSTHLPHLLPKPIIMETCLYTNSPDDDYILDRHPRHRNIIFGCGFSGRGFKTAPVVGKILARLALNMEPTYDLKPFLLSRFGQFRAKM